MNLDPMVVNHKPRHSRMLEGADQGLSETGDADVDGGSQEQPQHHSGHQSDG